MTEVRVVLGVLGVLLLVGFAAGCGLVSDQTKQEVKKKVEAGQEDLNQKVDDLQKKVEDSKEDLAKKLDDVQKDVNDLEKKVDELLKKVGAQEQQDQKK
jgi:TolA-binding protein